MARRKDSPQKAAMREMMRDYLKNNDISVKDGTDVNSIILNATSMHGAVIWHDIVFGAQLDSKCQACE